MLRSSEVGSDNRPPSAQRQDHEGKFLLVAVSQCVGRIGGRPQAVDGALVGEQWPDRPVERPPRDDHGRDSRHRTTTAVGGAELHLPRIGLDQAAEPSDLNGPSVEHLARAERFQVLGRAIEGIVRRRWHFDKQRRPQSLIEIQAADHDLCGHPLAPAPQVGSGWQDWPLVLHGRDTLPR